MNERPALPARRDEETLLTTLRTRAEQAVYPARIAWEGCERSAERDDLRARLALPRAAFDRLPSGCPWRGRVRAGRWLPRTVMGVSIGLVAPWLDLAAGGSGAMTTSLAVDWYRREQALWQQQYGSIPFVAAVAGAFAEPDEISPLPNLALVDWTGDEWQLRRSSSGGADLARLFYPQTPAEFEPSLLQRLTAFFSGLFSFPSPEPGFAAKRRATEAKLAVRTHEFQEAKRSAALMRADYERHAAAGDWSEEMLQIQLANGKLELRRANLLFQQIKVLQENLQTLSTAILGGEIVADGAVPVEEGELEALDRAYFQSQRQRRQTAQAERTLAENLLSTVETDRSDPLADLENPRPPRIAEVSHLRG